MSSLIDFLTDLFAALDRAGVEYMLTGSMASTAYSEPRATQDIDIVVKPSEFELSKFVQSLDEERFYVGDYQSAIQRREMFNVIESSTGWKLDLIIRKDRPFSLEEFDRRMPVELLGVDTYLASVEDVILAKLEWAKLGQSERQLRDVESMIDVNRSTLDVGYLEKWAKELDVWQILESRLGGSEG